MVFTLDVVFSNLRACAAVQCRKVTGFITIYLLASEGSLIFAPLQCSLIIGQLDCLAIDLE